MSIAYRGVVECALAVSRAQEGRFLIMRFSRHGKGVKEHGFIGLESMTILAARLCFLEGRCTLFGRKRIKWRRLATDSSFMVLP